MLINTPRHQLTAFFNRKEIHYGWFMVILAFTHSMFSAAAMGVPSVLIVPMAEDLGWTIGELSAPQGLRLALFGLCAPLACLLYTSPSPRDLLGSRMPSSA